MRSMHTYSAAWFGASALAAVLTVTQPVRAQTVPVQTEQAASLLEALSLISGRMLAAPGLAPEVTQDGDRFHVHIPLPKLTAPPDAAVEVAAAALPSGVWDITSIMLPSTGTLVTQGAPDKPPVSMHFTIGQQAAHARVDPTLARPSPYALALSDLAVHVESGAPPADLTIGQATFDGTITGDAGRMNTRSRTLAEDWHFTGTTKTGASFAIALRSANVRYNIDGVDRAQAQRMRDAARGISASQQASAPAPGQPPTLSPAVREQLHAILEASTGLLSAFDIDETLRGLRFETAGGSNGDVGEVSLAVAGGAADGQVSGQFDISLHDMTLTGLPALYAPRRIAIKAAVSGIPVGRLRHLLREAIDNGSDPALMQAELAALLGAPGAHAGIETLLIETGPLLLQGSAQVRLMPDGSAGLDIHLAAHGLDAMLALVQSDPNVSQIMPILYMAKGVAKPEGDSFVWDIGFADGVATVNGLPLGQRATKAPAARAPVSR